MMTGGSWALVGLWIIMREALTFGLSPLGLSVYLIHAHGLM
jgi:hypothetical protein